MEIKKSSNASNENLRFSISLMAFLFVGGLLLASFTYETMIKDDLAKAKASNTSEIVYQAEEAQPEPDQPVDEPQATPPPQQQIVVTPPEPTPPTPVVTPPPPPVIPGPPAPPAPKPEVFDFPDVEAKFVDGPAAMTKWIIGNVQYPETAIEMEDQGRVTLSFVVETDGSISNIKVIKGVTKELDREAKRLLRAMPKWIPGEVAGKRVRTRCSLPVVFTLE